MPHNENSLLFVVKIEKVAECLLELREQKIHQHFPGYLAVKRTATSEGRTSNLRVDFKEFYEAYLTVPGGSTPYVNAMLRERPSERNAWRNSNIAGSYAPSSIRDGQPFSRVVEVNRADATYSLLARHWELALEHLAFQQQLPAITLAVFLYRDYALCTDSPSLKDLVRQFQVEFGYLNEDGKPNDEFKYLYTDESEGSLPEEWFEEWSPDQEAQ